MAVYTSFCLLLSFFIISVLDITRCIPNDKTDSLKLSKDEWLIIQPQSTLTLWICKRFLNRRLCYCTKGCSSFNTVILELALCGDIHPHPGQITDNDSSTSHRVKQWNNLRCLLFNAQSLCSINKSTDGSLVSNLKSFQDLAFVENLDIITVTETWLNDNIYNNEILSTGYNIIRKDRSSGKRGGGVLIALRNNIHYNLVSPGAWSRELEIATVEIELINTKKTLICVCYRPPSVDINESLCLFTSFLESSSTYESILICGDFNFPDLYWNSDFVSQFQDISSGSTDFRELISDFFLQQINIHPTRKNNILDLVFTRSPETVRNLECVPPTQLNLFSDHSLLFFDFNVHAKLSACDMRTVYNYRLADWNGLSETLRLTDLMPSINSTDIDSDWQQWMDLFLAAVADHIPVRTFKRKNTPPWLDKTPSKEKRNCPA